MTYYGGQQQGGSNRAYGAGYGQATEQYDDESCPLMNGVINGTFFFNGEAILLGTRIDDIEEGKMGEVK
jgi:hypothetical protein